MTPEQKLKHAILLKQYAWDKTEPTESITAENIDRLYDAAEDDGGNGWGLQDARSEVRCGGMLTQLPTPSSRHYEADAVAGDAKGTSSSRLSPCGLGRFFRIWHQLFINGRACSQKEKCVFALAEAA